MKNILLLTDFSEASINAIEYTLRFNETKTCNFYLLHVKDVDDYISDDLYLKSNKSIYSSLILNSKEKLNELANDLFKKFKNKNFKYETIIDYDQLQDAVKQNIRLKDIDLVVMGSSGISGAKETVFGSNTINTIRQVHGTLMVIPENFIYSKPKKILLALDPFDTLINGALKRLSKLINSYELFLEVSRFSPENEQITREEDNEYLSSQLEQGKYSYSIVKDVPLHFGVDTIIQRNDIDMVSLIVQDEGLLERLLLGSTTNKISGKNRLPLLIFRV